MTNPDHLHFLDSHEWVDTTEDPAIVGISHHAQEEVSELVFVELPDVGTMVEKGEKIAVVESVKAASDIYAPVSGEIAEVNTDLEDNPALINSAPFTDGWLVKITMSDMEEVETLLTAGAYTDLIS